MNVTLISYSGRRDAGKCVRILDYVQKVLLKQGIESKLLKVNEFKISPCSGCNYECFPKESMCSIHDDTSLFYNEIIQRPYAIHCVPVYSSAPPALYFAIRERGQSVFSSDQFVKKYESIKHLFIVIGNKNAGADAAIRIILEGNESVSTQDILLLQSHEYNQKSIEGALIDIPDVQNRVEEFLQQIPRNGK